MAVFEEPRREYLADRSRSQNPVPIHLLPPQLLDRTGMGTVGVDCDWEVSPPRRDGLGVARPKN